MPEVHQQDWTPYRVGAKSANPAFTETKCSPLERVMHVTHVRHALSVLDAGAIESRLVYDESRLNTTRIHVVWLSPNTWDGAGGSRYGGVSFGFEWRALIEGMTPYWIGAMTIYRPTACRILLSRTDRSQEYRRYDPTLGDGPWWYEQAANKHWWNGEVCLEIMLENEGEHDLVLDRADGMEFVRHHAERCNLDPGGECRDANRQPAQASTELISAWASGLYAGRPFPVVCGPSIVGAWNGLILALGNVNQWGTVAADDEFAPILGRALLSASARRDRAQWRAIAKQFRSQTEAVLTLARIVATTFGVDVNELRIPRDEPEVAIKEVLDEAAVKALLDETTKKA
jgi:hypothetical protein